MLTVRTILILVAMLFADSAIVQSQVPSPAPLKNPEQKNQADPQDTQETASSDQRGTESSPLFIKVIPSLTVEPSPAKGAEHGRDYTSAEWWLVYITGALVLATSGLIIYTARLWGATKSLAEDAKNTATQQALDTQTSLRISRESADAAKKSVELAREEFLSTHRPRIILRDAFCRDNEIDHPIVVTYTLVNIGETRGRIVMWGADIQLNTGGDLLPYQLPSMYKHDSGFLDPGEERQDAHYSIRQWRTDDQSRHAFVEDSLGVFFCGHLIYEDDRMVRRHMAFWRKYDFSTSRFYIVSHHTLKALEYAD